MELDSFSRIKWERARDLRKQGAFREAERELREALLEQPDHPLLKTTLALTLVKQGRHGEAETMAQEVLASHPGDSHALYVLGEIDLHGKRYEKALSHFRRAAEKDQGTYLTLRIAMALRGMNRLEEALDALDNALIRNRRDPFLIREKAVVLNRLGRHREALGIYERLRRDFPGDEVIQKEMIRLKGLGRSEEQNIRELEAALKMPSQKENASLHELLAKKLKARGRLAQALHHYRKAALLQPENPYFIKQEGFCLKEIGRTEEAAKVLARAMMKDPDDFYVTTTLEGIYRKRGDMAAYVELLEKVFEAYPDRFKILGKIKKLRNRLSQKGSDRVENTD
ncbi:MAG: tetratricopeptide repeat protein [Deltaproteobacteria bacterium]|nr:tetratricopeptide repeat protein [Deltaproteobacteria bacterium]